MTVDRDLGDESDGDSPPWRTWRMRIGKPICYSPRSWREEKVTALPGHDGGDEDPWQPLSELSERRLLALLGF
jgi:hypothetical protein